MNAGLVTITNSNENYGNVFQNYAVIQYLKRYGIECETIKNLSYAKRRIGNAYIFPKLFLDRKAALRSIRFLMFRNKYLNYSRRFITERTMDYRSWEERYDLFICGSDQVWNPCFRMNRNWNVNLLRFVSKKPKIAFSASIGINELQPSDRSLFREALLPFSAISVREESAAGILRELTDADVVRLPDPVMLIGTDIWEKLAKPVKSLQETPFVLKYWLGGDSEIIQEPVNKLLKEQNCILVDITDRKGKYYYPSPERFLWLVMNSRFILTDSYHAAVFSILFHKRVRIYKRVSPENDMSDRIITLLHVFHIPYECRSLEEGIEIDGGQVSDEVLSGERERADRFWTGILSASDNYNNRYLTL